MGDPEIFISNIINYINIDSIDNNTLIEIIDYHDKIQYGNEIQIIDNKTIKYNNFEYILINTSPDKLLYKNDYYDDLF